MTGTDLPLHVETRGRAPGPGVPTYVLLHGFGASSFSWRTWAPTLAERGHVVLVDLKGFGRAARPDDGRYAPEDQANLVERLVRERDLHRVCLVGHSLGGGVALMTALRFHDTEPGRVQALVVVAGAAYRQKLPPFVALARWPRLGNLVVRLVGTRRLVRWVLRSVVHDRRGVHPAQVEGYAEPLDSDDALRCVWAAARSIVPSDLETWTARYPTLDVPTLVLWGALDRVVPLWVGRRLADELPDARLVVLDACGHIPAEERPEASLDALLTFLDEVEGGGG